MASLIGLSVPRMEPGAGATAREAHGVQPNSHHVPSDKGARNLRKCGVSVRLAEFLTKASGSERSGVGPEFEKGDGRIAS